MASEIWPRSAEGAERHTHDHGHIILARGPRRNAGERRLQPLSLTPCVLARWPEKNSAENEVAPTHPEDRPRAEDQRRGCPESQERASNEEPSLASLGGGTRRLASPQHTPIELTQALDDAHPVSLRATTPRRQTGLSQEMTYAAGPPPHNEKDPS